MGNSVSMTSLRYGETSSSTAPDPENPEPLPSGSSSDEDRTSSTGGNTGETAQQEPSTGPANGVYLGTPFVIGGQINEGFLNLRPAEETRLPNGTTFRPSRVHTAPTVKSALNLNKDTLKLIRTNFKGELMKENNEENTTETENTATTTSSATTSSETLYQIQFKLDALEACLVKVYLLAKQCADEGERRFQPTHEVDQCLLRCGRGLGQLVQTPLDNRFDLSKYDPNSLIYRPESGQYPLVITVDVVKDGKSEDHEIDLGMIESQTTYATFSQNAAGIFDIKPVKVTARYGSTTYLVHDLYGNESVAGGGDSDGGRECVICMCDPRDITVYPCNHLCLCSACAELFRFQTDKCPICRSTVKALLMMQSNKNGKKSGTLRSSSTQDDLDQENEIPLVKHTPVTSPSPASPTPTHLIVTPTPSSPVLVL